MNIICRQSIARMAKIIKVGQNGVNFAGSDFAVRQATKALTSGHVIAVPTDTIYGIAALAQNDKAIESLYGIKKRDQKKPIAICVANIEDIARWGKINVPVKLLEDLLPGPVTIVLERTSLLNPNFNPDTHLVGIRIPNNWFIRQIAQECGQCLALTSANISSEFSTLSTEEFKHLWPHLEIVFDAGCLDHCDSTRQGSTVVDLSIPGYYQVIRSGCALESTLKTLHHYNLQMISKVS